MQTDAHTEAQRLGALQSLDILDTGPEVVFDQITTMTANYFVAPICLVSLVDSERQWFKSRVGLDVCSTHRDVAFCDKAIRTSAVLVVPDTRHDMRFATNPLVTGAPHIRFYAGAPITHDGHRIGTLCIIDVSPRSGLTDEEEVFLKGMASIVGSIMDYRKAALNNLAAAQG